MLIGRKLVGVAGIVPLVFGLFTVAGSAPAAHAAANYQAPFIVSHPALLAGGDDKGPAYF
jgi:hypothetical protein